MKTKDYKLLTEKSLEDLTMVFADKQKQKEESELNKISGTEKNLKRLKGLRKEIAQILTLITEKRLLEKENSKQ